MIKEFVEAWESHKHEVQAAFAANEPYEYEEIVRAVVDLMHKHVAVGWKPDPARIKKLASNEYEGTDAYVLQGGGSYPSWFWYVLVSYGSCSVCDTLQSARELPDEESRVRDYMKLALHIVQSIKAME